MHNKIYLVFSWLYRGARVSWIPFETNMANMIDVAPGMAARFRHVQISF